MARTEMAICMYSIYHVLFVKSVYQVYIYKYICIKRYVVPWENPYFATSAHFPVHFTSTQDVVRVD